MSIQSPPERSDEKPAWRAVSQARLLLKVVQAIFTLIGALVCFAAAVDIIASPTCGRVCKWLTSDNPDNLGAIIAGLVGGGMTLTAGWLAWAAAHRQLAHERLSALREHASRQLQELGNQYLLLHQAYDILNSVNIIFLSGLNKSSPLADPAILRGEMKAWIVEMRILANRFAAYEMAESEPEDLGYIRRSLVARFITITHHLSGIHFSYIQTGETSLDPHTVKSINRDMKGFAEEFPVFSAENAKQSTAFKKLRDTLEA